MLGEQGLDDILLQLAERWNTIDFATQKYIATMAAGSRQQSRFIALLANYQRTLELVNAANNAAGASTEQFNKTIESVQSAAARLKNAWDTFLMGLANNQIIVAAINLLEKLISTFNKILSVTSFGNNIIKSIEELVLAILALNLGKELIKGIFGKVAEWTQAGKTAGEAGGKGISKGLKKMKNKIQKAFSDILSGDKLDFSNLSAFKEANLERKNRLLNILTKNTEKYGDAVKVNEILNKAYDEVLEKVGGDVTILANANNILLRTKIDEIALTNAEIAAIDAKIAGLNKETAAQEIQALQERKNSLINQKNDLLEAAATQINDESQKALNATKMRELALQETGIKKFFILVAQRLLYGKAIKAETVATKAKTAAELAAEAAQKALNKQMLIGMGIIGIIIVVVAALVALIVAIIKAIKSKTPEERLKKINEQLEKTKEYLDNANDALSELTDKKSELESLTEEFENLTEGTLEWKQKLLEINQAVLDLKEKFPELEISVGKNGLLQIDEDSYVKAIEAAQLRVQTGMVSQATLQYSKRMTELESAEEEAKGAILRIDTHEKGIRKMLRTALTEYRYDESSVKSLGDPEEIISQIRDLIDKINSRQPLTTDNLKFLSENAEELFNDKTLARRAELELKDLPVIDNINLEKDIAKDTYRQEIAALAFSGMEGISEEYQGVFKDMITRDSAALDKEVEKKRKSKDIDDKTKSELLDKYTSILGTYDELNEMSIDTLRDLAASYEAIRAITEEEKGSFEEVQGKLEELKTNDLKTYQAVMRVLSGNATGGDIEYLRSKRVELPGVDDTGAYLEEAQQKRLNEIEKYGFDDDLDGYFSNLSASTIKSVKSNFDQVFAASGLEAEKALATTFTNITKGLDPEEAEKFANAFSLIDITDIASIEGFANDVEDLGIEVDKLPLEELIQDTIDYAKAIDKIDLESVTEKVQSLAKILYTFTTEGGRQLDTDTYQSLVDQGIADPSDFVYNVATDTYDYIGKDIQDLTDAIREATGALTKNSLESTIRSNQLARDTLNNNQGKNRRETLTAYVQAAQAQGIRSVIPEADFENASEGDIETWYAKLQSESAALEENQNKLEALNKLQQTVFQANSPMQNAIEGNTEALIAQANAAGLSAERVDKYIAAITDVSDAAALAESKIFANLITLRKEAEAWELDVEAVEEYAQQLIDTTGVAEDTAYAIAISNKNLNKGILSLIDTYEDWHTLMTDAATDESIKTTSEYSDTVEELKKNVQRLLNTNEEISDSFIENERVLTILDELATGNVEHLEELRKLGGIDLVISYVAEIDTPEAKAAAENMRELLNDFSFDIEIGAQIEDEQFINACEQIIRAAGFTGTQVANIFKELGFDIKVTKTRVPIYGDVIDAPDPTKPHSRPTQQVIGYTEAVSIESITSAGSNGGSIDFETIEKGKENKKSQKKDTWTNPYDKYYNILEKINEALRQREKLESEYDRILNGRNTTGAALIKNSLKQIALLQKEIALQKQLQKGRLSELANLGNETYTDSEGNTRTFRQLGVTKYANYNPETGVITINWEAIDKIRNTDKGEAVQAYIDRLEEIQDSFEETQDTIEELQDSIEEIRKRSKEDFLDFEQRIYDALVQDQQNVIDNYQELSDILEDSNQAIINSLQESIDLQRQIRDNTKTEEDIADKERRLAYLRRDTSGANAQEILQLEQELEDAQESYQDTLIDQAIERLSNDNDKAAEQRSKQIEIMQAQLDYQKEMGFFWDEVYALIDAAIGDDGGLLLSSDLVELLQTIEGYAGMSIFAQANWKQELADSYSLAQEGLFNWLEDEDFADNATIRNQFNNLIAVWNNLVPTLGSLIGSSGSGGSSGSSGNSGSGSTGSGTGSGGNHGNGGGGGGGGGKPLTPDDLDRDSEGVYDEGLLWPDAGLAGERPYKGEISGYETDINRDSPKFIVKRLQTALNHLTMLGKFDTGGVSPNLLKKDGIFGTLTKNRVKKLQRRTGLAATGIVDEPTRRRFGYYGMLFRGKPYKDGGLVKNTGPAWLDGTRSKPEMVLDAENTKTFIKFTDILSSLTKGKQASTQSYGHNTFEIYINVDEIGSDYDVDMLVDRVKNDIYQEATHRNVNLITRTR